MKGSPPWRRPLEPWIERLGWQPGAPLDLSRLNALAVHRGCVNGSGVAIRFADTDTLTADPAPYEWRIAQAGLVATRTNGAGSPHDAFNALAWLAFPKLKAKLNNLHAQAISQGVKEGSRGTLRDRATLFDESGALLLTDKADLIESLRQFDWERLFVTERARLIDEAQLLVIGHAVQEKLCHPYKSICVQAWPVALSADTTDDEADAWAATHLDETALGLLTPLPVLGWPGWWAASESPEFYNDTYVFRRGRRP